MNWQDVAERAAKARCAQVLRRVEGAVAEHMQGAEVGRGRDEIRVRGRELAKRWIAEPGLRFARRIGR